MKLLEKDYYSFKAQSDKFIKSFDLKCHLTDEQGYLKKEHLNQLPDISDYETARGEIEGDELNLSFVFKEHGIVFEVGYIINLVNGEVEFCIDAPFIIKQDFVETEDMGTELVAIIRNQLAGEDYVAFIEDEKFDEYFLKKFMPRFIEFGEYLERLVSERLCDSCIHLFNQRLAGCMDDFYVRNRFKADEEG